ncbi:MAG: site-specific integrase [Comamonadaceae bacterium]|nr:MAG: site-specific integrase [Comamonadaceae bacterium]
MASIRQRADKWQARIARKGFPPEVRSFATRSEAVRWARQIESEMDSGSFRSAGIAAALTLRELLQRYMEQVSPTKRGCADEVIRIRALQRTRMAAYSLSNLTPEVIAAFRDERLCHVKAGAVIRDLSLLSSVINHARREWGLAVENPCALVRKPATPPGRSRVLSAEERERLFAALAPSGRRNPWMLPLAQLALYTAMRRGELLSLRWDHVDLVRRVALLPMTKNGQPRAVPLSSNASAVLSGLQRSADGRVFPVSAQTMEAAFKRARTRAGVHDLRFHDLRHTATSEMAAKLPNVIELASVTGHRTIQMLKRYYHPSAESLAQKLG